jgi:hypothetical protein
LLWYFGNWISWTIYPGLPQAIIFPILASQEARITGVSHWFPADSWHFFWNTEARLWHCYQLSNSIFTQGLIFCSGLLQSGYTVCTS